MELGLADWERELAKATPRRGRPLTGLKPIYWGCGPATGCWHARRARPRSAARRSPPLQQRPWANGEAVARVGAGITVADDPSERKVLDLPESTTIDELAGAVTSILENATYRREAGRVAAAMHALASVDESVRFIEEIAGSS